MDKVVIVIHGGAGPDSTLVKKNLQCYKNALAEAVDKGYEALEKGKTALDAVEIAVNYLEDHYLFNAGKGSALTENGEVEMGASIMEGKTLKAGAAAIIKNVKNPVTLARAIMERSKHTYLGDKGALDFAEKENLHIMPEEYFITEHAIRQLKEAKEEQEIRRHGTVGAVALDKYGNIAAATSTGGLENKAKGRIADSSMTGIGSYADNKTCAVSTTGEGEYLIQNILSFHVSAVVEYKKLPLKDACKYLLHEKLKHIEGDMGIIAVDTLGNFSLEFNSERMHRGWKTSDGKYGIKVYKD